MSRRFPSINTQRVRRRYRDRKCRPELEATEKRTSLIGYYSLVRAASAVSDTHDVTTAPFRVVNTVGQPQFNAMRLSPSYAQSQPAKVLSTGSRVRRVIVVLESSERTCEPFGSRREVTDTLSSFAS